MSKLPEPDLKGVIGVVKTIPELLSCPRVHDERKRQGKSNIIRIDDTWFPSTDLYELIGDGKETTVCLTTINDKLSLALFKGPVGMCISPVKEETERN